MVLEFHRRVTGYNHFYILYGAVVYNAGDHAHYNLGSGPGELLAVVLDRYAGAVADWALFDLDLDIDGENSYTDLLYGFLGESLSLSWALPFASHTIHTATHSVAALEMKIPYRDTFVWTLTNNGAAAVSVRTALYYRCFR